MIYELFYPLKQHYAWLSWLNVLRYIPFRTIMATITAMVLTFMLAPWFIRELQKKQIGQIVRSDGPESHRVKAGTPTMGGALILLSLLLPTVLWADLRNPFVLATTAVTAGYGVIGYLDDYLKIKLKHPGGLPGRYKLIGQVLIGFAAVYYTFVLESKLPADWFEIRTRLAVPFTSFSRFAPELPLWLYVIFAVFVVVGTSNAVNLTDGLDGLAIGP
ncbi:MAG: phospho-N-acetylmuramoyl-pentapeptide-transferase, partial [Deltaproteobacteria bacterium]|nr:phospho-N-acetylmuramoyl-pentapeptide-transferase [Deltaproteobacteria bacterium]